MTNDPRFIHLRVHTEYSLLDGAVRLKKLPGLCAASGMPAVAVTDTNNMFAALEFSVTAQEAGVQPIMGCQMDLEYLTPAPGERGKPPAPVVLLAQNEAGYENLMKLNSKLYLRGDGQLAHLTAVELEDHADGLICLSGGPDGPVGRLLQGGQRPAADALMRRLAGAFGDRLYVELQRHPGEDGPPEAERQTERGFVEMAYAMDLPLVATNDVHFPKSDMFEAHDALLCVADGAYVDQSEPRRRLTPQHYFKSQDEMAALFADLPEALENTVEIAKRCAFGAYRRDPILPRFADDEVDELRRQAREGLEKRLAVIPHAAPVGDYEAARFRAGYHRGHGVSRLFSDRGRFHQMGQGARHPGGAGTRLRCGQPRGLRADHHRSRPAAVSASVRALPEPRARVDARLRHRLLHGSPRGGDRIRAGEVRPRQGGADHHLRRASVQGGGARYRAGAADALRTG